jgi:hypothetical protein
VKLSSIHWVTMRVSGIRHDQRVTRDFTRVLWGSLFFRDLRPKDHESVELPMATLGEL